MASQPPRSFSYSSWRHGGWYVYGVRYPSGAIGCVSRNYPDKKWRIACDPRGFEAGPTFKNRDDAALGEWGLARDAFRAMSAADVENRVAAEQKKFPDGRADEWCAWFRTAYAEAMRG